MDFWMFCGIFQSIWQRSLFVEAIASLWQGNEMGHRHDCLPITLSRPRAPWFTEELRAMKWPSQQPKQRWGRRHMLKPILVLLGEHYLSFGPLAMVCLSGSVFNICVNFLHEVIRRFGLWCHRYAMTHSSILHYHWIPSWKWKLWTSVWRRQCDG